MATVADFLQTLLERVADGDMDAFRALYDAAAGRLMAIALNILRDPQAAEDAVQEAFLKIWRRSERYDPLRGTALAWMGVIARNAALDMVQARRPVEELEAADTIELATHMVEPPDARLGQCLKRLPGDQARAIVSMYSYGLSHSELAEHLSMPLGTVKSWVRRGTRTLKECMESLNSKDLALDFVFGSLSALERSEVARRRLSDAGLDAEIRLAEAQFAPLTGLAGEAAPSDGLFDRISGAIDAEAGALEGMTALPSAEGRWLPYASGIEVKRLWNRKTIMLRCQPGAVLPAHDHPEREHIIVISGDFIVGGRTFSTGDYHSVPAGTRHGDAFTRGGCILLVQYADG